MYKVNITFDIEFWYNSKFLKPYLSDSDEVPIDWNEEVLDDILGLLKKYGQKNIFFVTGKFAEKYPEIVKKIHLAGHEIGNHTYSHCLLDEITPEIFRDEIKKTNSIIYEIINERPTKFRAPDSSLTNNCLWALPILAELGIKDDYSIVPMSMGLYGTKSRLLSSYKISFDDITQSDDNSPVTEHPTTILDIGLLRIPLIGGLYFRVFPFSFFVWAVKRVAKSREVFLYIHQHEMRNFVPQIRAPWWKLKLKYWNVKNGFKKLDKFLAIISE